MPTIQAIMETVFGAISVAVEWFADNLDWLLPIMAGVLAGFVAFNIITAITGLFTLVTTAITGAGGAMALFNAIMLANPIGLIVVAIAALVAGIALLWTHWDDVSKLFSKTFDAIASGFEGFVNGIIGGLNWIIEKANQVAGTKIKTIGKVDLTDANNKLGKITNYQSTSKLSKYSSVADFADGGLAYGETAVNVGEYTGAKTNPEVIAPLDKLKDIISGTGKNITVNFYPQTMSENELENAFQYMNRKFGMEV